MPVPFAPENAYVAYGAYDPEDDIWNDEVESYREFITYRYPSLKIVEAEAPVLNSGIVAESKIAQMGISRNEEGIIAFWVKPKLGPLGQKWVSLMFPEFQQRLGKLEYRGGEFVRAKRWR